MNVLIVIPARGGSKGIPRKNLRLLGGKPLLSYSVGTALSSRFRPDVYVTSDDNEILRCATDFGANVHVRPAALADDKATLDPVIFEAYQAISEKQGKQYDLIVTLQPTSPLLRTASLDAALEKIIASPEIDTMISAMNDTHLTWKKENDQFFPNYEKRVNRQYLPSVFRETGGFLITRNIVISENGRIGKNVSLFELHGPERIDIDSYEDWALCEFYLNKRKVAVCIMKDFPENKRSVFFSYLNSMVIHQTEVFIHESKAEMLKMIRNQNYPVKTFAELAASHLDGEYDFLVVLSREPVSVSGYTKRESASSQQIEVLVNTGLQTSVSTEFLNLHLLI